jgi:hypothetical protein
MSFKLLQHYLDGTADELPHRAFARSGDGDGDGDGAGSGDGDGDGDGDGAGDGDDGDGGDGDGDGDGAGDGDGGDGDGDGDDDELRAENKRLQAEAAANARRAGEAERKAKKLERDKQQAAKKDQESQGEFETLYNQEKTAREEQDGAIRQRLVKSSVKSIAAGLGFINPEKAHKLVDINPTDVVDDEFEVDEASITRTLENLAKTDTYLVKKGRAQRDDLGGKDGSRNGSGTKQNGGNQPPPSDNKADWNPAETLRAGYASSDT